jgi:predicted ATPase
MPTPNKKVNETDSFSQREHHTITQTHSLCLALQRLHDQQLSHQHLSPLSVKPLPDHSIELIHYFPPIAFDSCHEISSQAIPKAYLPDFLSPEQRAQNNRTIDHSSDFFSIGILMAYWLTGETPLRSSDGSVMLQLPHNTDPVSVSIIQKLLSLYPEDRYLSINGLIDDLQNTSASTVLFFPGRTDKAETLLFTDLLFGREVAASELQNQFNDILSGNKRCILIAGEAGVGKTSLTSSTLKALCKQRGTYCYGKVDFITYHPYSAIINAFSDLVRFHITSDSINLWKPRLRTLLQSNCALIGNFIPELGQIMGTTFDEPDTDPLRLKNRLFYACSQLLSLFSSSDSPVVFYLDDLQWMTPNELELLHYLFESDVSHFLLIGAYRGSECKEDHPLCSTLKLTEHTPITLDNLSLENTREWIYNLFKSDDTQALTQTLFSKTHGNPFFTKKLLESLYSNNIIHFNKATRSWEWSLVDIQEANLADNVVHLILDRFHDLPEPTQRFLQQASCLGTYFKVISLAEAFGHTTPQISHNIEVALEYNFISETDKHGTYKFTHDRLLRNIYFDIPESKRQQLHWTIAQVELRLHKNDTHSIPFVEVCQHLMKGHLVIPEKEKMNSIDHLMHGAELAKANSDFKSALEFYKTSRALLPSTHWESHHNLSFEIAFNEADAEFLNKNIIKNYEKLIKLQAHCKTDQEKLKLYTQRLRYYDFMGYYDQAKDISSEVFKVANINISGPTFTVKKYYHFLKLILKPHSSLDTRLPEISKDTLDKLKIPTYLISVFYRSDHKMMEKLIFKQIELQSGYQTNEYTAMTLLILGIFLTHKTPFRAKGLTLCKAAIDIHNNTPSIQTSAHLLALYATFVSSWIHPIKTCIHYLKDSKNKGLESGDLNYTLLSMNNIIHALIFKGDNLVSTNTEIQKTKTSYSTLSSLRKLQLDIDEYFVSGMLKTSPSQLSKKSLEIQIENSKDLNVLTYLNIKKCMYYVINNKKAAVPAAFKALKLNKYQEGLLMYVENLFWSTLALSINNHKQANKRLKKALRKIGYWSLEYNQKTLISMYHILKSEQKKRANHTDRAIEHLKSAIQTSSYENNYLLTYLGYTYWANLLDDTNEKEKKNLQKKATQAYQNWTLPIE